MPKDSKKDDTNMFELETLKTLEDVREHIRNCESRHVQQVAYSTFHDALTQICFGCQKIRTNMKIRSTVDIQKGVSDDDDNLNEELLLEDEWAGRGW